MIQPLECLKVLGNSLWEGKAAKIWIGPVEKMTTKTKINVFELSGHLFQRYIMHLGSKNSPGLDFEVPGTRNPFKKLILSLDKGKGLKYGALGFRPLPGLGQKNDKNMKNGCFGVVRRAFQLWIMDFHTVFYCRFHGHNHFLPNPCFC